VSGGDATGYMCECCDCECECECECECDMGERWVVSQSLSRYGMGMRDEEDAGKWCD
jgi:hypothetical protein